MSSDEEQQSPTSDELLTAIRRILSTENLEKLSAKRVRQQLSEEFNTDLGDRKTELDGMIMKCVEELHAAAEEAKKPAKRKSASQASASSKKSRSSAAAGSDSDEEAAAASDDDADEEEKPKKKRGNKKGQSIYSMEMILSEDLAGIMGVDKMARKDVVKRMWQIFKERDLLDPNNRQFVMSDDQLTKVFPQRFRAFGLMKHLKNHLIDPRHI